MAPHIFQILAVNAVVLITVFAVLWQACVRMKDVTIVDSFWALGLVIMAASTFAQAQGATPRRVLILALCALWGLRLAGYLTWRWRSHGPDRRYVSLIGKAQARKGWSFAKASLLLVFLVQAPMLFLVSLPVQLGQIAAAPAGLGPLALVGAGLCLFGVAFESLGDWQLTRFRKDAASSGKVLDTGLWRYTRHPNYFGDACAWWGLFLVAAETDVGRWAVVGPVILTWTLMRWSGAPTLEGRLRKTRPDYANYIERTSGFVPWPPRQAG
jgi:steroid 5-alpha reductase family enzyme